MTAQIAIEAADFAALHTHAANRGEVLQVRFLHLCREVAGTTTTCAPAPAFIPAPVASVPAFIPAPPVPGLEPVDGPPDFSALTSAMHR